MNEERFPWAPEDATTICREHNQRVAEAEECGECFHPLAKHGPDGCTAERTVQIEGSSETMHGPCGCEAVTFESDMERDLRVSGPTFAEGQARLARALNMLTEAAVSGGNHGTDTEVC